MALIKIAEPSDEPITLAEARLHLRCDPADTSEDATIAALIVAARRMAEHELGRSLIAQTWELVLDAFPAGADAIVLPVGDALSVVSIEYVDVSQVVQTMDPAHYELKAAAKPCLVLPAHGRQWPTDVLDSLLVVRVRFTCGYGAAPQAVPPHVIAWMKAQMAGLWKQRTPFVQGVSVAEVPNRFVASLLDSERLYL